MGCGRIHKSVCENVSPGEGISHQSYSEGIYGCFVDVLVDVYGGYLCGMICWYLVVHIFI